MAAHLLISVLIRLAKIQHHSAADVDAQLALCFDTRPQTHLENRRITRVARSIAYTQQYAMRLRSIAGQIDAMPGLQTQPNEPARQFLYRSIGAQKDTAIASDGTAASPLIPPHSGRIRRGLEEETRPQIAAAYMEAVWPFAHRT
jgi:hypothetical protein